MSQEELYFLLSLIIKEIITAMNRCIININKIQSQQLHNHIKIIFLIKFYRNNHNEMKLQYGICIL